MVALVPVLLIVLAACAAFGLSLAGSFHFDDYSLFTDAAVMAPSGWLAVWLPGRTRPLTYLSFWLNYQVAGQEPVPYHAVNLGLHVACALVLWKTLERVAPGRPALLGALLFAVHPMQSEAVAYIFARSTLLMTLFCLLALLAWSKERPWHAVAWFAAALLAKEECVAIPALLALLHFTRGRKTRERLPILTMFALSALAGARLLWITSRVAGSAAGFGAPSSPFDYFLAQGVVLWRYLRLLIVPFGFSVDPAIGPVAPWLGCLGWLALVGIAAPLAWRFRRHPATVWLVGGFLLLLPTSSLIPVEDLAADRRLYLPLIALSAGCGMLLARLPRPAVLVGLVVLALLSAGRMSAWRTEESLWSEAERLAPRSIRPKLQLARVADPDRALALLDDARLLAPNDPRVAAERGRYFLGRRRPELALGEFGRALALEPRNASAINNRGVALLALGQREAARLDFERALKLAPCSKDPLDNLRLAGGSFTPPPGCR